MIRIAVTVAERAEWRRKAAAWAERHAGVIEPERALSAYVRQLVAKDGDGTTVIVGDGFTRGQLPRTRF